MYLQLWNWLDNRIYEFVTGNTSSNNNNQQQQQDIIIMINMNVPSYGL
jgi:hypothetical protein